MSSDVDTILSRVVEALVRHHYRFSNEASLHDGIAQVLRGAGIEFTHEYVAGPRDRFDFLIPPGIVIEAKVKGSMSSAAHQVDRYAARDDVKAIVLATTRFWSGALAIKPLWRDKPMRSVRLKGAAF